MDNMNKKEQLLNEGYLVGRLDFNEEIDSLINQIKEISNIHTNLECRYEITGKGLEKVHHGTNCSYDASLKYDEYVKNANKSDYQIYQKWYLIKDCWDKKKPFEKLSFEMVKEFYDFKDLNETINNDDYTMYNDDCFIVPHADNKDNLNQRVCVVLIYLNKDIPEDASGGELIITDNHGKDIEVKPVYGNYAILDFTKNNLVHRVTPVKNYKRYTYINFVHKK